MSDETNREAGGDGAVYHHDRQRCPRNQLDPRDVHEYRDFLY